MEHKEEKKFYQNSKKKKRIKQTKTKDKVRNLWDNFKRTSIQIMGVPEGEGEEQEIENLFKNIMTEKFPNLVKEIDMQVQEAQRIPNKTDPNRTTPRHIIIKMLKTKTES